jgi:hypothetical protein
MSRQLLAKAALLFFVDCGLAFPQNGKPTGGQNVDASTLPGETYRLHEWPSVEPAHENSRVVTYRTVQTPSTTQPVILEPVLATFPSRSRPLMSDQKLIIRIDDPDNFLLKNYMFLLNLDVTSQSTSAINSAPVRPTISPSGGSGGGGGAGANAAAAGVSPLIPALIGIAGIPQYATVGTKFTTNLQVLVTDSQGHPLSGVRVTFTAPTSGPSGHFGGGANSTLDVLTNGDDPIPGIPCTSAVDVTRCTSRGIASAGDFFANNLDGTYIVTASASAPGAIVTFACQASPCPSTLKPGTGAGASGTAYFFLANIPCAPRSYYLTWENRLVPDTIPTISVTGLLPTQATPNQAQQQSNTSAPSAPSEQVATLLNMSYPQVHSPYYFNVSTGVIRSSLRNPSWTRQETAPGNNCPAGSPPGCMYKPEQYANVKNPGSPPIDPALFFTAYLFGFTGHGGTRMFGPFDAERKWHASDLMPEPSVGLSLSSPATDFFFGFDGEVMRGIQVVAGWHEGKINSLAPGYTDIDPTSSATPPTVQNFQHGYFFGVTFNINFIQSLFGGGSKGGGQ